MKFNAGAIARLLKHPLVHNVMSLFGARTARYILPLVSVPYLARVLGADGWGRVAFAQSFAALLALGIEYGFTLSATRELSQVQHKPRAVGVITGSVLLAKGGLSLVALLVAAGCVAFIPLFVEAPVYFFGAVLLAVVQGNNLLWYFQGIERLRLAVVIEVVLDVLAVGSYFLLVNDSAQAWRVLFILAASGGCCFIIRLGMIYKAVPFVRPSVKRALAVIKKGWHLFLFRSGVSLYTAVNPLILGLFTEPVIVGYFVGAEKIIKALTGLLDPISKAFYPRMAAVLHESMERARRLVGISFWVQMAIGGVLSVGCFFMAPYVIRLILGADYQASVGALRIMAIIPLLVALSNVLGVQWAIPLGLEARINRIIIAAGLVNILLSILLAPLFEQLGMAISVAVVEGIVTVGIGILLYRRQLLPFSSAIKK